jgi:hypothetical protein|uniref:2-cysteine adaptor domain-containing protein n=1 Tax=viral metagenome TaxID=1070528 RepID=A0A6C0LWB6_9ZZZZ
MPLRLNDEQCLLWIKDPSISPYDNDYVARKYRKDILMEDSLNNPRSFLNKVKRKCFYNSALRPKIVEQIKEYQRNKTLRLHTLNDKLSAYIEYITPPFNDDECKQWANNHTINPRTNKKIPIAGAVYVELIYTAIQYGLPTPSILDTIPDDKYDKTLYRNANNIIKNVLYRLEFMKQNDELFLTHDTESFDRKLKIASSLTPMRKAAAKDARQAIKPNNSHGVSSLSSSYKSLNSAERRQLRDIELENKEEKNLIAEYQYKKRLLPKKDVNKTFFSNLREIISKIHTDIKIIIENILKDATEGQRARLTVPVHSYINRGNRDASYVKNIIESNNLDTAEGVIYHFINNIYAQLIDPLFVISKNMEITCFSYINIKTYFKNAEFELIKKIILTLFHYIDANYSFRFNIKNKTIKYIYYIIEDLIPRELVAEREVDVRTLITTLRFNNYQNYYYKLLLLTSKEPKIIRLPEGMGLLIGNKLTNAIDALEEAYFNTYPEDRVITDDNPLNGFTYKECKDWVIMPIINPRTFKSIKIDSPIYNRLLCMSYQYDTKLIPRMITSRGYKIIEALTEAIEDILKDEGGQPQSREQLEKYIRDKQEQYAKEKAKKNITATATVATNNIVGLKWKNVGIKKPATGIEVINKKIMEAFLKSTNQDGELPFYVSFNKEELAKFGITTAITKNSYIEISTYYIQVIDKNKTANNIGLRWKIINNERYKEGIKREGVEIINKKLKKAFLKLASKGNVLPSRVSFSNEDLKNFGITTTIAKNRYIKFTYYYKPVIEKSAISSYVKPKTHSSKIVIKKRDEEHIVYKYYTVADCLRWARQPNRDPKDPNIIFPIDSEEYNVIFEQALLYDFNITPINITSKGIKFRDAILKISEYYLTITKYLKHSTSKGLDIDIINSTVCNAIKKIYDDETNEEGKKYKKFKDKMIEKCKQANKPSSICIDELKNFIEDYFQPIDTQNGQYKINYYQDSALASILIEYENIKGKTYREELRDIFIQNINAFYVYIYEIDDELNEIKKEAIDAGGPKRDFFTNLFEELFCDDEHLTRPFICPKDNIGNKYYVNPNFVPDEKFRKVIEAYKQNHTSITEFKTEREYEYIYYVIGKLLGITFYNQDIGLPQQFSDYILTGFIKQPNDIDYYDILYFYFKEFNNAVYYINMISNRDIDDIDSVFMSFNDTYNISRSTGNSGAKINKENCIKFLLQQSKHAITKNCFGKEEVNSSKNMKRRYDSLFAGFGNEIRKFLYKKKVTIEQLNLLITNEPLTYAILNKLANKFVLKIEVSTVPESDPSYDPNAKLTEEEKNEKVNEMKGYISNIITRRRQGDTEKVHFEFIKKLLRFWTAINRYYEGIDYKIFYKYGWRINVENLPEAHTCFNQLDIYGFPPDTADKIYTPQMREDFVYKKLLLAVAEQQMELR